MTPEQIAAQTRDLQEMERASGEREAVKRLVDALTDLLFAVNPEPGRYKYPSDDMLEYASRVLAPFCRCGKYVYGPAVNGRPICEGCASHAQDDAKEPNDLDLDEEE